MSAPRRSFLKMSGSGNDFVVFDRMAGAEPGLLDPAFVGRLCARGTGIGADGVVVLEPSDRASARLRYVNADGSPAFCGNATLCGTRLAVELGVAQPQAVTLETEAGLVTGRLRAGLPEIDIPAVTDLRADAGLALEAGEERIGYAVAGVPHLVVLCRSADSVDLERRGRALRRDPSIPGGANANFVSRGAGGRWRMRTFERGVEGETLACGSGAVCCAAVLNAWGLTGDETVLLTSSGRDLRVTLRRAGGGLSASLGGEGRIVYRGELSEL